VADLVLYLCSPGADMIRGQTVVVDGGWSLLASLGATGSRPAEPGSARG
jgi:NAD(P)-dependent dehydrogenase (short-subunit alcohol dehydrogenase family)